MEQVEKHLRRVCPVLLVSDASRAAEYYRDRLGFQVHLVEGAEFAIVARDNCQIFLKRGLDEPSRTRNRNRTDNREFYDLFFHCDSMPAFEALYSSFTASGAEQIGPIDEWSGMRVFSLFDLDGYKPSFARSI